ncbi:MAG TPA: hemerythrin domain-containing protein [Motilibacteraceae bacterium]|nr:hemerythrin domain-containing protein [Motilibacteraceae bacterium]
MTTTPASGTALRGPGLTDVRGMVMAHDAFRWSFAPMAGLVRAVAHGDTCRAGVVGEHVATVLGVLEGHHTSEDEHLWPRLLQRVPDELAPVVHLMESHHEGIHERMEEVLGLLPQWRARADAADGRALADAVQAMVALLDEHLAAEETHLLPIAARNVTQGEWDEMTEQSLKKIPLRFVPVAFGVMRKVADPEVVAADLAKAPAPIRLWLRLAADRAARRYAARLGVPL